MNYSRTERVNSLNHGSSPENCSRLHADQDGSPAGERIRRIEEMAGNLIRFVANTQVKIMNNEAKLLVLEKTVYDLESTCTELLSQAAAWEKRIARLEEAIKQPQNAAYILSNAIE